MPLTLIELKQHQELAKIESKLGWCLVLATENQHHVDSSWIWHKSEDYRENLFLHQCFVECKPLALALFLFNASNPSRPMTQGPISIGKITKEGSAAFKIERVGSIENPEEYQEISNSLANILILPKSNILSFKSKRSLNDPDAEQSVSKRQIQTQVDSQAASSPLLATLSEPVPEPIEQQQPTQQASQSGTAINFEAPWRETKFGQISYRSKLEAQTACFMQNCNIRFTYESISLHLSGGNTYTPDFWLPHQQLFIEIKPAFPHVEEIAKCEEVAASGFNIVLLYGRLGPPMAKEDTTSEYRRHYEHSNNARGVAWSGTTGKRLPGEWIWGWDNVKQAVVLDMCADSKDMRWSHPKILDAYESAQKLNNPL